MTFHNIWDIPWCFFSMGYSMGYNHQSWNHGMDYEFYDFPETVGRSSSSQLTFTHSMIFQRAGVGQPPTTRISAGESSGLNHQLVTLWL